MVLNNKLVFKKLLYELTNEFLHSKESLGIIIRKEDNLFTVFDKLLTFTKCFLKQ